MRRFGDNWGQSLDPFISGEQVDGYERTGREHLVEFHFKTQSYFKNFHKDNSKWCLLYEIVRRDIEGIIFVQEHICLLI